MKRANYIWGAAILIGVSMMIFGFRAPALRTMAPTNSPENKPYPTVSISQTYGKLPLSFEANRGQTDSRVKFLSRGRGYALFLTSSEAVLALRKPSAIRSHSILPSAQFSAMRDAKAFGVQARTRNLLGETTLLAPYSALSDAQRPAPDPISEAPAVIRMKLVGANPNPKVEGLEKLPGKSNYFIGNDPKKWRTNVPQYAKVKHKDIYPGIDLVYYGNQGQLEHDFVVAPGADPRVIALNIEGAERMQIDSQGDLVLSSDGGDVRLHKPVVYQPTNDNGPRATDFAANSQFTIHHSQFVDGRFVLLASNRVGLEVANYDKSLPLIIDPVLVYSTYLGGSGFDTALAIAWDSSGNAYVTGTTDSTNFPTANSFQASKGGSFDAFVAKLNADGSALVYSTYLGGSLGGFPFDHGRNIAIDAEGNAYVVGPTNSTDFPTTSGAFDVSFNGGNSDAFVTKLNAAGNALIYSSYLGGSSFEDGIDIVVGEGGNAHVTGDTFSSNFPTTLGAFQPGFGGFRDAFVAKVDATGSALVYSTFLGGSGLEEGFGVDVDAAGNAYVTGVTDSPNFPTTSGSFQVASGGFADGFVSMLNASGSALVYSTHVGGDANDVARAIAVDDSGSAYVTGDTASADFPTANAIQTVFGGVLDAFISKLNPSGSALIYSTYLGGSAEDSCAGIALDEDGNAYLADRASSINFPTTNPLQAANAGGFDAFVTKLNAAGSMLLFSTYLGGSADEPVNCCGLIAVNPAGSAYVTGLTASTDFPTVNPFQSSTAGGHDAFAAKISPALAAQVQQPINADGSSVFSAKRGVVPVKFTLTEDGARTCQLPPATLSLTRTAGAATGPIDESVYILPSDTGSNFRISDCQYVYNLRTSSLGQGTYLMEIKIGGEVIGSATFGLN